MRSHKTMLATGCAVAFLMTTGSAAAYPVTFVDTVATAQGYFALSYPPSGSSSSSQVSGPGILGGEREISITLANGTTLLEKIEAQAWADFFMFSSGPSITGSWTMTWDGADSAATLDPRGLGSVDLTRGGEQHLLTFSTAYNDKPMTMLVEVYSGAGNVSTATVQRPGGQLSAQFVNIPFTAFTPSSGSGADFSDVGAIRLIVSSAEGAARIGLLRIFAISKIPFSQSAELVADAHQPGVANAGDVIRYTMVVENSPDVLGLPETGISMVAGIDPNTTLVPGSVNVQWGPAIVTSGNGAADTAVRVDVATLPDDQFVTVSYEVVVNASLPAGISQISNQSTLDANGIASLRSDGVFVSVEQSSQPTVVPASAVTPVLLQSYQVD